MANFTPNGIISIGRVPFDNSYRHTMTFPNAQAQSSYFASVCPKKLSGGDYTYVRMNNSIKVPYNAEELYTYNYVMYQNSNYGTKWFYAFIVGINYVNRNTTELVLQLDVMQTWYFDYKLSQCFVEREHVNDDRRYAHTVAEPDIHLEHKDYNVRNYTFDSNIVCVLTTAVPKNVSDIFGAHAQPVTGDRYNGVYQAAKMYAYDVSSPAGRDELQTFFTSMNTLGAAEAIVDVFTLPSMFWQQKWGINGEVKPSSYSQMDGEDTGLPPINSLDGYTPRNNKLFCAPYCYGEVGDFTGNCTQYLYENFGDPSFTFKLTVPLSPTTVLYAVPSNYAGDDTLGYTLRNCTTIFQTDITNKSSWIYSVYQNWAAQNRGNIAAQAAGLGLTLVGAGMAGAAAGALGAGTLVESLAESGALASFTLGSMNMQGELMHMASKPNKAMGNMDGNARLAQGYLGVYLKSVGLKREYAEIVDDFFDMFGYEVDVVKVPNRTGRPSWNYVKTRNACHHGNVPASDMALINSIFDNGITFWHTADVGNYSRANK